MPTDRVHDQVHSSDVAFLLPIVRRLGVDQVVWLAQRAGQIVASEVSAAEGADLELEPVLKLA